MKPIARLFASLLVFCITRPAAADRPDILLIAVDDLRPMLGCYGDTRIQTPNIDRLAKRAVVFDRAYCQYAKCGTSRLSLMTGLRPDAIGVFSNNEKDVIDFRQRRPDAVSLARWFKRHSYHTQSFGKIYHDGWDSPDDWSTPSSPGRDREMWEITDENNPTKPTTIAERLACPVMQSPDVADDHLFAGRMTQQVLQTMRNRTSDGPVFLAVGFRRPHLPFVAPQRYFDLYQPDKTWLAANPQPTASSPVMAWFNSDGYVGSARKIGLTMPNPPNRQQAIDWNGYEMRSYLGVPKHGPIETKLQLELLHAYAACISYVDAQIGKLLDELQASGRRDNTIVVLLSDHGWHLGEQSAWGKMTNFEIATRVPLLMSVPGTAPARTQTIAELVDLYPTLCSLAGVETPTHLEGESFVDVLRQPHKNAESVALSQYSRFGDRFMGRALRTNRYRFVLWEEVSSGEVVARELYDHENDSRETINLAGDQQQRETVRKLEQQLRERFRR